MRFPGKGVITLYNRIISRVSSDFDMLLEDTDIDTIILGKNSDYSDSVIRLVKQMTKQYVDDFLGGTPGERNRLENRMHCVYQRWSKITQGILRKHGQDRKHSRLCTRALI